MKGDPRKSLREANKTSDSTFDRIYKSYFGKIRIELKPDELRIRERLDFAYRMMCQANTDRSIVNLLMNKFNIEKRQAYNDIKNTIQLFGSQKESNKDFKRIRAEHWIIQGIKKAWKNEDLEAYHRLLNRYTKINGLDVNEDNALADIIKQLRPTALIFTLNAEQLKKEADSLTKDIPADDVEYQDVT